MRKFFPFSWYGRLLKGNEFLVTGYLYLVRSLIFSFIKIFVEQNRSLAKILNKLVVNY
jgi:hypothetical protein